MQVSLSELYQHFASDGLISGHRGEDVQVTGIAPVENCGPGDLVFVDHAKYLPGVLKQAPAALLTTAAIADELARQTATPPALLITDQVRLAIALIKQAYNDRDYRDSDWDRRAPSAIIHPKAVLADDVMVGPGAVIGADVILGAGVVVMANVVIERGVRIGARTVLHPGVVICPDCEIGEDCMLKPGCVIGSEGFGFAQDAQRRNYRIPHTGRVIIGDRVVIGANTTIDRGTYDATRIGSGTIIDALVHLGHNVELGEDCILCAHTGLSGSTRFGKRVIATGQTGSLDHVQVADDVVLLHRAGLNNSIKQPGMYAGGPAQPLQQYLKNMAVMPRLHEIWTRLRALEKKVDQNGAR
ncbi:MAG: UDP-3-O-3-hydroxymyristoyl glucosamine N-acyltransferase [Pseudomonadota bacterium]|jgi:UDP-3-O-[3-hydroxymyristoyl] glucosamine N-acyltransferase